MGALINMINFFKPCDRTSLLVIGIVSLFTLLHPFLGILAVLLITLLCQARENYGVLEKCGIPVIKPTLFLGSEPNFHKTVLHLEDVKRFKKYGGIWGSYLGREPYIYIADPELLRLVMVKDFDHFVDKRELDTGSPIINESIDFQPGEKWKQIRSLLSPLFTTSKLKQMSSVIAENAVEFVNDLKSECNEKGRIKIDCKKRLTTWLIDMFTQATLGIRLEDSKNPKNKFAQAFQAVFGETAEYNFLFTLSLSFPFLTKFAPVLDNEPVKLIESTFRQVIAQSRKQGDGKTTKNFLDVLVDMWERVPTKEFQDLGITENTVISQAIALFTGGYDTSSSTLTHLFLHMAENPEIQDKMYNELQEALARRRLRKANINTENDSGATSMEIDHELVSDSEIPYIVACINETLRLAPSAYRTERKCSKDWSYKGISIKKGTVIMMPCWAVNRNPEIYPDEPDKFKPERFLPEAKAKLDPYGFSTFGFGPRNCLGMRFAYENLKLVVCNVIKNFRVEKRADTTLNYKKGALFVIELDSVYIDLVKRK